MPTNKPKIQAILEKDIYEKFKKMCDEENRSESNLAGYIITQYIKNIETKNQMNLLSFNESKDVGR